MSNKTKDYKDYILEQLSDLKLLSKPMMGGYLFYYENTYLMEFMSKIIS